MFISIFIRIKYIMAGLFRRKKHTIAVVTAVIIWSISFIATKKAMTTFPPLTLGALRFIFATSLLGAVLFAKSGFVRMDFKDFSLLILSGSLGVTIYFSMENIGVKLSTSTDAALIIASYPAISIFLEMIIYDRKFLKISFMGILLAVAGVYLIVMESSSISGAYRLIGDIILAGAGVIWSFYNFMTRRFVNKYSPFVITFYQTAAGAVLFLPLAWTENKSWIPATSESLTACLYLGLFCSFFAFLLYAYGLKGLSSSSAITLMNLVPVLGVIFSTILLDEPVSNLQFIGGLIVISGIALTINSEKRKKI